MKILVTGSSQGIGKAVCLEFLKNGHTVYGIDILPSSIEHPDYVHFQSDISIKDQLPQIDDVEVLINNAGIQTATQRDFEVNLFGTMQVTEKYAFQKSIKSVLFNSSVSALNGNEFTTYVASKSAVNGYMKNCAIRLANEYKATCNAICFGGVSTELNNSVMEDKKLWDKIMEVTPLKRWCTPKEAAQWCYFLTAINTFCTGQTIDVSGGERNCLDLFVWPEE